MNKENRPGADLFPEDAEGDLPFDVGIKSPLIQIEWIDTAPRAVYLLDQYTGSDFRVDAFQPGGRFKISYTRPGNVVALNVFVRDPSGNAGAPEGYGFYNYDNENDAAVDPAQGGTTTRGYYVGDPALFPPFVFYVSAFRHEKRELVIEEWSAWVSGAPAGTLLRTRTIVLTPPPTLFAAVTCESPDGFYSPRWRKVSFIMSPNDMSTFGNQPIYDSSYIVSATRLKSDSFEWPNGTNKYKPGRGRDVWLWRPGIGVGTPNAGGLVSRQYENQGQFRRVMEVGNSGGNGFVEYERPFSPALAPGDGVWFVDRCVMARTIQMRHQRSAPSHFDEGGDFAPQIGPLYVDTWKLPVRWFTNFEMPSPFRPGNVTPTFLHNSSDWIRGFIVQAYAHDANYGDSDGNFETTPGASGGYSQDDAAEFPESPLIAIPLFAQHWPTVLAMKIRESMINSGKVRIELDGVKGDVCRWRLYLRTGNWPTVDNTQTGTVDEQYFIDEYRRFQEFAETSFTFSGTTYCIIVPVTIAGEYGAPCRASRTIPGPETAPIIYNLKVTQADSGGISKHLLTWQSNGAAQDITYGFRIEHLREDHKGQSHGENPTSIIYQVNNGVAGGSFTHDGSTAGATIDTSRGNGTNERTITHHYHLYISIPDGFGGSNDIHMGHVSITDTFSDAREADVSLGTLHATIIRPDVETDADLTTTPLTAALALTGARNVHFNSGIVQNSALITYEFTIDGGSTWHRAGSTWMDRSMSATKILAQIWGKRIVPSGGTVVTLQFRAYYQRGTDFTLGTKRGTVTSAGQSIRIDDIAPPGPF